MSKKSDIKKITLVNMMTAGKNELKRTSSPKLAWEAAKAQNNLPPTMWDKYITAAMLIDMWYALSV